MDCTAATSSGTTCCHNHHLHPSPSFQRGQRPAWIAKDSTGLNRDQSHRCALWRCILVRRAVKHGTLSVICPGLLNCCCCLDAVRYTYCNMSHCVRLESGCGKPPPPPPPKSTPFCSAHGFKSMRSYAHLDRRSCRTTRRQRRSRMRLFAFFLYNQSPARQTRPRRHSPKFQDLHFSGLLLPPPRCPVSSEAFPQSAGSQVARYATIRI